MAESLNKPALKTGIWASVFGVLFTLSQGAAETLIDPTRPPASPEKNSAAERESAAPVLQSILISPTRRIAIISGSTLKAGDKFGNAQLLSIGENEVVLRTGKNLQVLKLHPSLHKRGGSHADGSLDSPERPR